jgi:hypothetical protein
MKKQIVFMLLACAGLNSSVEIYSQQEASSFKESLQEEKEKATVGASAQPAGATVPFSRLNTLLSLLNDLKQAGLSAEGKSSFLQKAISAVSFYLNSLLWLTVEAGNIGDIVSETVGINSAIPGAVAQILVTAGALSATIAALRAFVTITGSYGKRALIIVPALALLQNIIEELTVKFQDQLQGASAAKIRSSLSRLEVYIKDAQTILKGIQAALA